MWIRRAGDEVPPVGTVVAQPAAVNSGVDIGAVIAAKDGLGLGLRAYDDLEPLDLREHDTVG